MKVKEEKKASGFIWNMIGGGLVACQSALLMLLAARFYDQETAGMISISYAIAILAFTISRFGMRNYQVTDAEGRFPFKCYRNSRYITIAVTMLVVLIYLVTSICFNKYSLYKSMIVMETVLLRMISSFEDVYLGRFQQMGYFAVGAKIMAIREIVLLGTMCAGIICGFPLLIVLLIGIMVSALVDVFLLRRKGNYLFCNSEKEVHFGQIGKLLEECFPLCLGTSLAIYVSNIPKYVTDRYLDEMSQAIVGYLILPVFVITLLNQFIYTPFIKDLGDLWNEKKYRGFYKKIIFQSIFIIGTTVIVLASMMLIGLPILSWVYVIDLTHYRSEFAAMLVGGALYALEYYLVIPLTIIHEQKKLAVSYIISIVISLICQKGIVTRYGLLGVAYLYIFVNLLLTLIFGIILFMKRDKA